MPNVLGSGNSMTADTLIFGTSINPFSGMPLGHWLEGDRITALSVRLKGAGGTNTPTLTLILNKGDGSPTTLATLPIVHPPTTWATYSVTLGTPHVMLPGESLYLNGTDAIASDLGPVGITSDRL